MENKVLIGDFGSQYTQLIARRIRELFIFCEIYPYNNLPKKLLDYKAVVFSGSPYSVYQEDSPNIDLEKFIGKIPVLAICYGAQFIANNKKAIELLNWEPKFGLSEGLDKTIKFFKNNLN